MNCLALFGDFFEDTEAIASIDVLLRGGEKVTRASMMNDLYVKTQCGSSYKCDVMFDDIDLDDYDYLLIPGGRASFTVLKEDKRVTDTIHYFAKNNKLIASICAAPHLVGRLGYFKGLNYTVFPGFEDECIGGTYKRELGVCRDALFITAKSMYYSIDFALEILNFFYGEEKKNKVELSLKGE